jgi:hypothetical protein
VDEFFVASRSIQGGPATDLGGTVRSFNFPIPGQPDIRVVVPEKLDNQDACEMVNATLRSYIRLNAKANGINVEQEGAES